jgi:hypothetical protein
MDLMMKRHIGPGCWTLLCAGLILAMTGGCAMSEAAELEDLDGVRGKVFRADVGRPKQFELLKETVFDPADG